MNQIQVEFSLGLHVPSEFDTSTKKALPHQLYLQSARLPWDNAGIVQANKRLEVSSKRAGSMALSTTGNLESCCLRRLSNPIWQVCIPQQGQLSRQP